MFAVMRCAMERAPVQHALDHIHQARVDIHLLLLLNLLHPQLKVLIQAACCI